MTGYVIGIALFLVPLGFLSHGSLMRGQGRAFVLASTLALASKVRNKWIMAFMAYVVAWALCLYATEVYMGVGNMFFKALSAEASRDGTRILGYTLAAIVMFVAVSESKAPNERYYNAICIVALFQAALGLVSLWPGWDYMAWFFGLFNILNKGETPPPFGTLFCPNYLAAFLAVSVPFFVRDRWAYCLVIVVPVMLACATSTATVALTCGMIVFYYKNLDKTYFAIAVAAFSTFTLCYLLFWDSLPVWESDRFEIWAIITGQIFSDAKSLFLGHGPGAEWAGHGFDYSGRGAMHNDYLTAWFYYGAVGLSLVIGYVSTIYRGNRRLFAAFVVGGVDSLGNHMMEIPTTALLFIAVMGLIERERAWQTS